MKSSRLAIATLLFHFCLGFACPIYALAQFEFSRNAAAPKPVLDLDSESVANYRAMNQGGLPADVQASGLEKLNASGSAQFNEPQFAWIRSQTRMRVLVVDLREESHAVTNHTKQIGWQIAFNAANRGKSLNDILKDESEKIATIRAQKRIQMFSWEKPGGGENWQMLPKVLWDVNRIVSERELVGAENYIRIPVTDHDVPDDEQVDAFLKLVSNRDANTWLHFHCLAGMGRTTTFLAMLDMLSNANTLSFEDILRRQTELGGIDLLEGEDDASRARRRHLREFFDFARQYQSQSNLTWQAWKQRLSKGF